MDRNGWIPHDPHPKQRQFLLLADVPEVMYGGAAGGGKSDALLMAAAQYADVPGYAALLLRKTFPDLNQPGALIPRSKEWWMGRATWHEQQRRWTFPSGATITFGYLERDDDVYQYMGAEYQMIGLDEGTQHTEFRFRYLFSRLRRPKDGPLAAVPLRMRVASNPGNIGHVFFKRRYIDPQTREPGAVFVPARLEDNPSLDAESYRRSLTYLDPITRAQLLAGDWDAVQGGRFKREWLRRYQRWGEGYRIYAPGEPLRFVHKLRALWQTCDPAASEKRTADYTVISTWGLTDRAELLWLDCARFQADIPDIPDQVAAAYRKWKPAYVAIEAVGANSAVYKLCRRMPQMVVKQLNPLGEDKLVRATPAMNLACDGRLYLPDSAPWLDDVEAELLRFTGDPKKDSHDDIVDTLSYAVFCMQGFASATGGTPYVHG